MLGPRPKLGEVKVGDRVLAWSSLYGRKGDPDRKPAEARISKVGRTWLEITEKKGGVVWRLRKDTQTEDKDPFVSMYSARFVTPEQYEWDLALAEADRFLTDQEIYPRYGQWAKPERRALLADLVRSYLSTLDTGSETH